MLPKDAQIISVDDHVIEHPRVWLDRLPSKYAEVAPRITRLPDGNDAWIYEGEVAGNFALNAVVGKSPKDYGLDPRSYDDMLPGCHDIQERLKDMDTEGVWAQLCFPNMGGFAGSVFARSKDKALANECVKAYNDFILDEWCASAPERQIPLMMTPYWDVEATVAEVRRTAAKGAKSFTFPELPDRLGLPSWHSDHWDPVLAAVTEAGLPLSLHFGSGGSPQASPEAQSSNFTVAISLFGLNSMSATAELLLSPVFHKFPDLKIALSEGGIGWMPYMIERIDYVWERHRWYNQVNRDVRPSELFRDHLFGCFISDNAGIHSRHLIGVDNIMFESDYPHSDSNWPHTRKILESALAEVPDEEAHKMVEWNARKLYNFPRTEPAAG
ncbi:amidohydrolase family protein [Peterkaempfera bronchialis]|uniref:Amidohydrolase n=1 Tax=Peterkaempfera bronchialis TaxID=2126346 RepID=A0A345SRE7_9ACTN|nr:amidohydrolase family protein [Peterkaempfera bronchialis]AXI76302.1 amidohydrolase [Peterkaempfera bronchialis]